MHYRTKVLLFLLAAVVITGGVLLWLSQRSSGALVFRLIQEKVLAVAVSAAPQVDGEAHDALRTADDGEQESYLSIQRLLRQVRDANQSGDLKVAFVYTIRPTADGQWEYVVDAEEEGEDKSYIGDLVEFREGEEIIPNLGEAHVDSTFAEDSFGTWLTAFAPVRDSSGKDVALLGVDIEAAAVKAQMRQLLHGGLVALGLAMLAAAVASFFLARRATAPLKALEEKVIQIGGGDFRARAPVESNDEFGKLAVAVNCMASGLQEREAFKGALVRFVSGRATEEVVADHEDSEHQVSESRRVTVLSVALLGFDAASRKLSPEKVSVFLSEWYAGVIDVIVQHRGALEKSDGQTLIATFGAQVSDSVQERHAIESALTMQQAFAAIVDRWRESLTAEVELRVVIHSGIVDVRGTDDEQTMDAVMLGELISIVAEVHAVADDHAAKTIISAATANGLRGTLPLGDLPAVTLSASNSELRVHSVEMPMQSPLGGVS